MSSSPEDKRPVFYYVLRDQRQDVRGVIRSFEHFGKDSMLGAFKIEEVTRAEVETLEAFGGVDTFDIDPEKRKRINRPVPSREWGTPKQ